MSSYDQTGVIESENNLLKQSKFVQTCIKLCSRIQYQASDQISFVSSRMIRRYYK